MARDASRSIPAMRRSRAQNENTRQKYKVEENSVGNVTIKNLVYVNPDGTEQILQNGKVTHSEEKSLFTQGQNEISILSNNVVFKEIDISITGIQASDF